jgi:hypothetical protein
MGEDGAPVPLAFANRACQVLRPTLAEFRGFEQYLLSIEDTLKTYGIVKVVPPRGWAKFTAYGPAAQDPDGGPADPAGLVPKFKVITQAPAGKLGVIQLGIKERKAHLSVDQFREEALRRDGG